MGKSRLLRGAARTRWSGRIGPRDLAPGPLPAVRRRHHLLGARRDREGAGRHPGVGSGRRWRRPSCERSSRRDRFDWIHERLLPLVGVESGQASREESFAAWRVFLEGLAADGPAVVVIEDLHWADDALLAFLEEVANEARQRAALRACHRSSGVPRRAPGLRCGALPNAHRLELAPLSTDDTTALVASLLGSVVPPDLTGPILERADGNPLYAEEYVALASRSRPPGGEPMARPASAPASSFRSRPPFMVCWPPAWTPCRSERKALLTDAAVVGKVFWDGALVAMDRTGTPRGGCRR